MTLHCFRAAAALVALLIATSSMVIGGEVNWFERGNEAFDRNQNTEALKDFTLSIQQLGNDPRPYYSRARVLRRLGRPAEAIADVRHAVALSPNFAEGFWLLADLLQKAGSLDEAATSADRSIALDTKRVAFRLLRADIALDQHDDGRARQEYEAILQSDPANVVAIFNLAGIELRARRRVEAVHLLERYLALSPPGTDDNDVVEATGSLLVTQGDAVGALAYLDSHPSSAPGILRVRARALSATGKPSEAIALLKNMDDPLSSRFLGEIAFAQNRCADAESAFARAAQAISDPELERNLAAASMCARDFAGAERAATRAIRMADGDAMAYRYRSDARRALGNVSGSIADARAAIARGGPQSKVLMLLGIDEYRTGDHRRGYADYRAGCAGVADPSSDDARLCREQLPRMHPN